MMIDTDIECYSGTHIFYLSIISLPMIVIWVFFLPILGLVLLAKNIKKSNDNNIKRYFLILYQGLKHDKYYWEFMNTGRKVLILILFPLSISIKLLGSMIVLVASTRLQIRLQPFREVDNNELEILGTTAGVLTLGSGLLYSNPKNVSFIRIFIVVFTFAINCIFILKWLCLLTKTYKNKNKYIKLVCNLTFIIFRYMKL